MPDKLIEAGNLEKGFRFRGLPPNRGSGRRFAGTLAGRQNQTAQAYIWCPRSRSHRRRDPGKLRKKRRLTGIQFG